MTWDRLRTVPVRVEDRQHEAQAIALLESFRSLLMADEELSAVVARAADALGPKRPWFVRLWWRVMARARRGR